MNHIVFLAFAIVIANFSYAFAQANTPCQNPGFLDKNSILSAVENKLVCAKSTTNKNRWSEEHLKSGDLYEYAKGSGDKVDPRRKAGTWAVKGAGNNTVIQYNYGTGGTYDRGLWTKDNTTYTFCDGSKAVATATIISPIPSSGANPCP